MKKGNRDGFTLIEMLVTVTIFLVILFPFVTTYVVTGKINQDATYQKKATDVLKFAQEDIRTWDDDILETLSERIDSGVDKGKLRAWKYERDWNYTKVVNGEKETTKTSMYQILRDALDGKNTDMNIEGSGWQKGMDVYFTVEKKQEKSGSGSNVVYNDINVVNEEGSIDIRSGYDLSIRVVSDEEGTNIEGGKITGDMIKIIQRGKNVVSEQNNNSGSGYYLKVTLANSGAKYQLKKIPVRYIPLEKYDGEDTILFGGRKWLKVFSPTPGDVALMYAPEADVFDINMPFDANYSTGEIEYKRTAGGWSNLASYLNGQFYNSLAYSTVDKYYSSRSWIKKHTWQIGGLGAESSKTTTEYIGLLRYNEIGNISSGVRDYLSDSCNDLTYTLTPVNGSAMYLVSGDQENPKVERKIYPVIYLDKELYLDVEDSKLYEQTDEVLKQGGIIKPYGDTGADEIICQGSTMKMLVYFDNDLGEANLEGDYFEKVKLLVDVVDNRSTKTDDGLQIYTVNNKKRNNYDWLEVVDATRTTYGEGSGLARFKIIDSVKADVDAKTDATKWSDTGDNRNTSIKKVYRTKEYEVRVWAEYMATDEVSRVNPDDYVGKELPKNKHESLTLTVTVQKDDATFVYGSGKKEVDNMVDIYTNGFIEKLEKYYKIPTAKDIADFNQMFS